jgi:hypothetical protein
MLIAGQAAGVDQGHVDGDLGSGPTGCLRLPGSLQTHEPAANLGQHEIAADEGHLSVPGRDGSTPATSSVRSATTAEKRASAATTAAARAPGTQVMHVHGHEPAAARFRVLSLPALRL